MGRRRPDYGFAPVAGGDMLVARWGAGERVALAVHGGLSSHLAWSAVAARLGAGWSVLAPDLRGSGYGAGLPPPYGMAAHADDLCRVLDANAVDRCALVGWSLGGFVAAATAARHGDRFSAVVLVDGGVAQPLPPDVSPDEVVERFVEPGLEQAGATFPSIDAYVEHWLTHPAFAAATAASEDVAEVVAAHARHMVAGQEPPAVRVRVSLEALRTDVAETLLDPATRDAAPALAAPTTFLRAGRGLVDEPGGYYGWPGFEDVLDRHGITLVDVPDANHYTLVFGAEGAAAIARALTR